MLRVEAVAEDVREHARLHQPVERLHAVALGRVGLPLALRALAHLGRRRVALRELKVVGEADPLHPRSEDREVGHVVAGPRRHQEVELGHELVPRLTLLGVPLPKVGAGLQPVGTDDKGELTVRVVLTQPHERVVRRDLPVVAREARLLDLMVGNHDREHWRESLVDGDLTHRQPRLWRQHSRLVGPRAARADPNLIDDSRVHNFGRQLHMPVGDRVERAAIDCHPLLCIRLLNLIAKRDVDAKPALPSDECRAAHARENHSGGSEAHPSGQLR